MKQPLGIMADRMQRALYIVFSEGTLHNSIGSDEDFLFGCLLCGSSESGKWREGRDAEKFTPYP